MGKFALLAALLVASAGASAGALKNPDTSGETHGDEVVFEIHDQQLIGLPHSTEHRKGIFVSDDDPARHVGAPNAPKPPKPHEREHPKSGELWHPGPKFTNLTIYQVLSADEQSVLPVCVALFKVALTAWLAATRSSSDLSTMMKITSAS